MRLFVKIIARALLLFVMVQTPGAILADGGMYPISMLDNLPLRKAGLKISINEIYNPGEQALMQAVVQIGGCTGSFVSGKGLIITNHHCAFGGLQAYSSPENNLLEKGYLAKDMSKELPVKGLTVKILESYEDVSEAFTTPIKNITDALEKKEVIADTRENLLRMEKLKHPDMLIEVSEMLPGKSYIVFRYRFLKDIRIVYIPARNIGEFGGETDNWEWPRHTGDFSFLRAYAGPDGRTAEFDSANVPYEPKEYLNVSRGGVDDGDFVFILGYPGRTYRHQPAEFIKYQRDYQLPFISELYKWQIASIKELGKSNEAWKISYESKIKRLANVEKNYEGKIKSLDGLDLYTKKKDEEEALIDGLKNNPGLQQEYRQLLTSIDNLYAKINETALKQLYYNQLLNENNMLKIAYLLNVYTQNYTELKDSADKLNEFNNEVINKLRGYYRAMYVPYDSTYLFKMLSDGMAFSGKNTLPYFSGFKNPILTMARLKEEYKASKLLDSAYIFDLIRNKPKKLVKLKEPYLALSAAMYNDFAVTDSLQSRYKAELDALLPRYVDIKMEAMGTTFIPDANSTLRFTYGYIKGYAPRDGVYYSPLTSVDGMIAKDGMEKDYNLNETLQRIYEKGQNDKQKEVPICMLYNTDTSGGNSGSPILNKFGQLVGVNFDRAYEATVNDFAWDDKYSRSIGLDMRFVLWMLSDVVDADHLVDEMFIDQ